jgi:hypothetical protein
VQEVQSAYIEPFFDDEHTRNRAQLSNRRVSPTDRHLESATDAIKDIMGVLINFLGDGGITVPYCFGDCPAGDAAKRISGEIVIKPSASCDEISLIASAESVTLNNVGYLLLREINDGLADALVTVLGVFGDFGVKDPVISLSVSTYPKIVLSVSGTPSLPGSSGDLDPTSQFFNTLFESLNFKLVGTVQSREFARIRLEASILPIVVTDWLSFSDVDNNGPNVFVQYEMIGLPTPTSQILTFGLTIPLTICVSKCDVIEKEVIVLTGTVYASVVIGVVPATILGGLFTLVGEWREPFGIPILNINAIIAGVAFDVAKPFPTPPNIASVLLGADICLGSGEACKNTVTANKDFIAAAAYIQVDVAVPQNNFFIAMVSAMTVEHVLRVAAVLEPGLLDLIEQMPDDVLVSGITPYDATHPDCATLGNKTAQMLGEETLNLNCYAYFILSPFKTNEIKAVNLVVPRGISFGGTLNLFNKFYARMEARVRKRFVVLAFD